MASPTFTGTVTLPNGTVTLAEQANFAASSLMGNPTGSSAAPSAITLGANLSFSGTTLVAASVGGGMAIGSTVTSGTSTYVLFVDSSGFLAQSSGLTYVSNLLSVSGSLQLSGTSQTNWTTPAGTVIGSKVAVPLYNLPEFSSIFNIGLPATASPLARAFMTFDARSSGHQPTMGTFSAEEGDIFGFSWDGNSSGTNDSNSAYLVTIASPIGIKVASDVCAGFFAGGIHFPKKNSVGWRRCGIITSSYNNSTDATWTGNLFLSAGDYTSSSLAQRIGMQVQSNGSVPLIGFYGGTPVVQPATTGTTTGMTTNTGTPVLAGSTFTGNTGSTAYTIGDIVNALKNLGLLTA